jgi:hypothetical protein
MRSSTRDATVEGERPVALARAARDVARPERSGPRISTFWGAWRGGVRNNSLVLIGALPVASGWRMPPQLLQYCIKFIEIYV